MNRTCENCAFFSLGECLRFPEPVAIARWPHWFGEHRLAKPKPEILALPISEIPKTTQHSRLVCKRLGLQTVEDLIDAGRGMIRTNSNLDRQAITELHLAMESIGIEW